jgi:hypothetical protein
MEIESDSAIPFLGVLVIRKGTTLDTKVYRKPIHTGYINVKSYHPQHVKRGLIQGLHNRTSAMYQERQDLFNEIDSLRSDSKLNGYLEGFVDSVINCKNSSRPNNRKSLWALRILINICSNNHIYSTAPLAFVCILKSREMSHFSH